MYSLVDRRGLAELDKRLELFSSRQVCSVQLVPDVALNILPPALYLKYSLRVRWNGVANAVVLLESSSENDDPLWDGLFICPGPIELLIRLRDVLLGSTSPKDN